MARGKKYPGVYERKDTDGRSFYYMISVKDPGTGKRKQKKYGGFSDPETAYKEYIDTKNKQNKGLYIEPTKLTLKEWLDLWITEKQLNISPVTIQNYKNRIKHIVEAIGSVELFKITKETLIHFHSELNQKNKVIFKRNKYVDTNTKLSERTVYDTLKVLKMALIQAYTDGKLPKDIGRTYKLSKATQEEQTILKIGEIKRFLDAAKGDRMYCAIYLGLTTGMRESEILGLNWKDINFDDKVIYIVRRLQRINNKWVIRSGTKTKAGTRPVEIDDDIIKVLMHQRRLIESEKKFGQDLYKDTDLVCPTNLGTPMNPSNLRRSLYRIFNKAGIPKVTFHELRHSHATHLLQAGVDVKTTSHRLGHSSIRTTLDIYQHVIPGMQREALEKLRKRISN
ncbi:tyrosine-type recombinase/integrase [Paenibacillus cremeus]|uniref:Site-specific integrase n=1 Tax=Paenibacillus cremeus TaxID=2163881 RepID=A0A559K464_9BACL|nr:tyrosine-type recombinase/integrase [Paenibacillus cremeus]TVY06922.1 site-specific integrase [Paenibacillus cremeus]